MSQSSIQNSSFNQSTDVQNSEKIVGFDTRNKDSLPHSYICQICTLLLRDPVQFHCGHRFCRLCLDITKHVVMKCVICNEETAQDKILIDRACKKDMEKLAILCSFCDWDGNFKDYEKHINIHHTDVSCQYCNRHFIGRNLLVDHQLECENKPVNCQLKQYGCIESFLRKDTEKHLLTEKHQSVMSNVLSQTKINLINNQQFKSSQMDFDLPHTMISTSTIFNNQLNETIDVLLGSIQVLNDDTQRISSESLGVQYLSESISEDLSKTKTAVQESNACIEGFKTNQQILQQDLASLNEETENMVAVSYDGTFLWKITDVNKKIADAQSEKQTSIYSPPFYSSPDGYKMRIRLYLNGDGNARRTHMSLFFILMRGRNDAILQFPFNSKVTFCLYDQTGNQRHIIDSFRPNIKSDSFQRPSFNMNIASGIPKFFPLPMIQQEGNPYVRNDTMFIKVIVHFNDTPKTLLPYILNINPGVSLPHQQSMINQEIEKRTQQQITTTEPLATPSTGEDLK